MQNLVTQTKKQMMMSTRNKTQIQMMPQVHVLSYQMIIIQIMMMKMKMKIVMMKQTVSGLQTMFVLMPLHFG